MYKDPECVSRNNETYIKAMALTVVEYYVMVEVEIFSWYFDCWEIDCVWSWTVIHVLVTRIDEFHGKKSKPKIWRGGKSTI